jgi:hypothetical protein
MNHFIDTTPLDEANATEPTREILIVNRGYSGGITMSSLRDCRGHAKEVAPRTYFNQLLLDMRCMRASHAKCL